MKLLVLLLTCSVAAYPLKKCGNLPNYFMWCGDFGGSDDICCDGRYAEAMRTMCAHPGLEGPKCRNVTTPAAPEPTLWQKNGTEPDPDHRIEITSDQVDQTPTPWEYNLYDKAFSASPLLFNQFSSLEEAKRTVELAQTCTPTSCTVVKVPCVRPYPWQPCKPTHILHEVHHNVTLGEINERSVGGGAAAIAARAVADATKAPITVERYCVCPAKGSEIHFWRCTEAEFAFCVKNKSQKCPPGKTPHRT